MKKMKKVMALLLSLVMVLAMSVVAFANNAQTGYTLTINNTKAGHTYNVYQIFTGEISDLNGAKVLSNVKYGASYTPSGKTAGGDVDSADLSAITDAKVFAENFVKTYVKVTAPATPVTVYKSVSSVKGNTVISDLPAGYYLVMDGAAVTGQDATTQYIVQVVGDTSVAVKSDFPTVEKKVQENAKNVNPSGTETDNRIPSYNVPAKYNDVADYNIGDKVPFQLIGTLPSNYADYTTYKYIFHDTLSNGLTYNGDAKVYVLNGTTKTEITDTNLRKVEYSGTALTVTFNNLKAVTSVTKDSKIIVDYTATLNTAAQIGLPGNPNEVYLEFSNNPNKGGDGETGSTPKDKVIVFTYELDVTKVEKGNATNKLKDAEFKLRNSANKWVQVDTNGKVTGWGNTEDEGSTLKSGENGLFKVIGLDDGVYYLKETKAPQHYNLLSNEIKLTITATTSNGQTWESGEPGDALTVLSINVGDATESATGDIDKGIVSMNVENSKGSTLPTTGGMGTTIFYVIGSILVLGAAILLITKKRMSAR